MTPIAVTGATGQLGRLVVEHLLERDVPADEIVATVRDPSKAADLVARGIDVRLGDYSDPATLPAALAEVDILLLVSGGGQFLAQHAAVIDAARQAGIDKIVYTSALRAGRTQLAHGSEHLATEKLIQESGLEHAVLRNGQYIENHTGRLPQFVAQGEIVGATADTPFAAATRADYAEAAAAILVGGELAGEIYELGGDPYTMSELAAAISEATGTAVTYRDVSTAELLELLQASGVPESFVRLRVELDESIAIGAQDTDSGDLQRLLGRPSTPLVEAVEAATREHGISRSGRAA